MFPIRKMLRDEDALPEKWVRRQDPYADVFVPIPGSFWLAEEVCHLQLLLSRPGWTLARVCKEVYADKQPWEVDYHAKLQIPCLNAEPFLKNTLTQALLRLYLRAHFGKLTFVSIAEFFKTRQNIVRRTLKQMKLSPAKWDRSRRFFCAEEARKFVPTIPSATWRCEVVCHAQFLSTIRGLTPEDILQEKLFGKATLEDLQLHLALPLPIDRSAAAPRLKGSNRRRQSPEERALMAAYLLQFIAAVTPEEMVQFWYVDRDVLLRAAREVGIDTTAWLVNEKATTRVRAIDLADGTWPIQDILHAKLLAQEFGLSAEGMRQLKIFGSQSATKIAHHLEISLPILPRVITVEGTSRLLAMVTPEQRGAIAAYKQAYPGHVSVAAIARLFNLNWQSALKVIEEGLADGYWQKLYEQNKAEQDKYILASVPDYSMRPGDFLYLKLLAFIWGFSAAEFATHGLLTAYAPHVLRNHLKVALPHFTGEQIHPTDSRVQIEKALLKELFTDHPGCAETAHLMAFFHYSRHRLELARAEAGIKPNQWKKKRAAAKARELEYVTTPIAGSSWSTAEVLRVKMLLAKSDWSVERIERSNLLPGQPKALITRHSRLDVPWLDQSSAADPHPGQSKESRVFRAIRDYVKAYPGECRMEEIAKFFGTSLFIARAAIRTAGIDEMAWRRKQREWEKLVWPSYLAKLDGSSWPIEKVCYLRLLTTVYGWSCQQLLDQGLFPGATLVELESHNKIELPWANRTRTPGKKEYLLPEQRKSLEEFVREYAGRTQFAAIAHLWNVNPKTVDDAIVETGSDRKLWHEAADKHRQTLKLDVPGAKLAPMDVLHCHLLSSQGMTAEQICRDGKFSNMPNVTDVEHDLALSIPWLRKELSPTLPPCGKLPTPIERLALAGYTAVHGTEGRVMLLVSVFHTSHTSLIEAASLAA